MTTGDAPGSSPRIPSAYGVADIARLAIRLALGVEALAPKTVAGVVDQVARTAAADLLHHVAKAFTFCHDHRDVKSAIFGGLASGVPVLLLLSVTVVVLPAGFSGTDAKSSTPAAALPNLDTRSSGYWLAL